MKASSKAYERALATSEGRAVNEAPTPDLLSVDNTSNGGPPLVDPTEAFQKIDDLYEEAKNFADGEPITTPEMAEAITALFDGLHEAGKEAEALRVAEKKPLDDAVSAIQDRYNPYVQAKKGKVALGKEALGALLTAWRVEQQRVAAEKARIAQEEAAEELRLAQELMRSSSGNLEAREQAEQQAEAAKQAEKFAKKATKVATTGTGLRTSWVANLTDEGAALDWAYGRDPARFRELVQQMADEAVRGGMRAVPGFDVKEEKKAA